MEVQRALAVARERISGLRPRSILATAWLLTVAYAYPGYLNWDSGDQIYQARIHKIADWHPPIMAKYWQAIELVVRGPFGMLLLQTALFTWGLYELARRRIAPRAAAWVTAALTLFPPILTPMAAVWKDAHLAGFLAAGLALALRPGWRARAVGLAMLLLAAAVRDNGVAALPPMCLLIVTAWGGRRLFGVLAAGTVLCLVLLGGGMLANTLSRDQHAFPWYKTVAIHDIAGTICYSDRLTDEQVRGLLSGIPLVPTHDLQAKMCKEYTPRVWFMLTFGGDDHNIFGQTPNKAERLARRVAWKRLIREQPAAFLTHRWQVMKEVLGLTSEEPWEPVCQSFAANADHLQRIHHDASLSWFQRTAGKLFSWFSKSLLYRPWVYVLLSFLALAYAVKKRDGFVAAIVGSGLLYEASFFVGAAAPDWRYSHWLVTCCCLALCIIFADRWRDARVSDESR